LVAGGKEPRGNPRAAVARNPGDNAANFPSSDSFQLWRLAMGVCQAFRVEPSLLLHPLDLLGGDDETDLGFFPGMAMPTAVKSTFVGQLLADFAQRFNVVTIEEHAERISARTNLRVCQLSGASRRAPMEEVKRLAIIHDAALPVEVRSQ
jgi:hypothetical protein